MTIASEMRRNQQRLSPGLPSLDLQFVLVNKPQESFEQFCVEFCETRRRPRLFLIVTSPTSFQFSISSAGFIFHSMGSSSVAQTVQSALRLCYLGNPVLRRKALAVERGAISKPEFQNLIREMHLMLSDESLNGIGLAAPQVRHSLRMFLYCPHVDKSDSNADDPDEFLSPRVMINPVIKSHCNDIINDWEQCLSVPGLTGLVPRWHSISVDYLNDKSEPHSDVFHGVNARTVQHEIDHLDGVIFIDKTDCKQNLFITQEYERLLDEEPEEILKREYPTMNWSSFIQH